MEADMRIRKPLILILSSVLLIGGLLVQCHKKSSTGPAEDDLVGTWVLTGITIPGLGTFTPALMGYTVTVTLRNDGTYTWTEMEEGNETSSTGTWSATSNTITLTDDGETESVPYALEGNQLSVTMTIPVDLDDDGTEEMLEVTLVFTRQ